MLEFDSLGYSLEMLLPELVADFGDLLFDLDEFDGKD